MADIIRRRVAGFVKTKNKPKKRPMQVAPPTPKKAPPKDDTIVDLPEAELSQLRARVVMRAAAKLTTPLPTKRITWEWWVGGSTVCLSVGLFVWAATIVSEESAVTVDARTAPSYSSPSLRPSSPSAGYPTKDNGDVRQRVGNAVPGSGRAAPTDESFLATFADQRSSAQNKSPNQAGQQAASSVSSERKNVRKNGGCVVSTQALNPAELERMSNCLQAIGSVLAE